MAEIDRKIQNKVLQLGSLNDEMNNTVGRIEKLHSEQEEVLLNIENIKKETRVKEKGLIEARALLTEEEYKHRVGIKKFNKNIQIKSDVITRLVNSIASLERDEKSQKNATQKAIHQNGLLKKEKVKAEGIVAVLNKKLEDKRNQERLLEITRKNLENTEQLYRKEQDDLNKLTDNIEGKKNEAREWLKETKEMADNELGQAKNLIKNLKKQNNDLRIVEGRLRKHWSKATSKPFPNIYHS